MDKVRIILSKDSFTIEDIDFLMNNKHLLTNEDLVRLGLDLVTKTATVVSEPEVKVEPMTGEAIAVQSLLNEPPKRKRGRPRKVSL